MATPKRRSAPKHRALRNPAKGRAKTHKDVEFHVTEADGGGAMYYKRFDEACSIAVGASASQGRAYVVDVIVYSASGARWWGGAAAVESYREDPDASVFERIKIRADNQGRVA